MHEALDVKPTTRKQSMHLAGVIGGAVVLLNVIFYVGSHFYYAGKPAELAEAGSARFAFATMTVLIAAMAYAAAVSPRLIGHGLAAGIGFASLISGIAAFATGLSPVIGMTMLVVGGLLPALAYKSW